MNGLLRVPDAARRCGIHDDTIRRAIKRGELPAVRAFNRTWIRETDLRAMLTPRSATSDQSGVQSPTTEDAAYCEEVAMRNAIPLPLMDQR